MTPDLLISIIKGLLGLIGAILMLFITMVGILHRGMTKRLDMIELDLKPIVGQVLLHTEQIKEMKDVHLKDIKDEQVEIHRWLNNHDTRIQVNERTLAIITKNK